MAEGEGVGARLTGYRWHVPGVVPCKKSLRVEIEHWGWTYNADGTARSGFEERPDNFSSVAFWYQKGGNEDLPKPPCGSARLPRGNAEQIEVENSIKEVSGERGEVSVQKEVFWAKDLLFFKAEGSGAKLNVRMEILRDGRYEVVAQIAQAPDYGDYVVTLDGKLTNSTTLTWGPLDVIPPEAEIIRNYQPEIYVAPDHRLGWFDLTKGRHVLAFSCVGKDPLATGHNLGIDDAVLSEVRKPGTLSQGKAVSGELPQATPGMEAAKAVLYRGEPLAFYLAKLKQASQESRPAVICSIDSFGEDPAPAVKDFVSAALALREMGKSAVVAILDLCAALKDSAPTVRMSAATALGHMGEAAKSAVPTLTAALEVPDEAQLSNEEVQVIRNIAYALGDIGPDARTAVPALKKIHHLRVKYIMEEAIAEIEGRPVPTWHRPKLTLGNSLKRLIHL